LLLQGRARIDGKECWVAVASSTFARHILSKHPLQVSGQYNRQTTEYLSSITPRLVAELMAVLPQLGTKIVQEKEFAVTQRWGAGFVDTPLGVSVVKVDERRIVACGDFCLGSTFENAAVSGLDAAKAIDSWASAAS
jgi:predicted NAD/FAD-dependent oxidoreductase